MTRAKKIQKLIRAGKIASGVHVVTPVVVKNVKCPSRQLVQEWWRGYLTDNKVKLSVSQRKVANLLIGGIASSKSVSTFFRARRTGVTFLLNHFETFCRTP